VCLCVCVCARASVCERESMIAISLCKYTCKPIYKGMLRRQQHYTNLCMTVIIHSPYHTNMCICDPVPLTQTCTYAYTNIPIPNARCQTNSCPMHAHTHTHTRTQTHTHPHPHPHTHTHTHTYLRRVEHMLLLGPIWQGFVGGSCPDDGALP